MDVRAKFRCQNEKTVRNGGSNTPREYEFTAMYDDGTPENQRFAKATPVGRLTMTVDNPDVTFEPGKSYYLDFTEAG